MSEDEIIHGHQIFTHQVISYLLANNFLLTALELLLECEEVEREEEVAQLRLFFSDQGKFPQQWVQRFQDVDAMRALNLQKQREEQLSFTSYQLRIAQEDLKDLQPKQSEVRNTFKLDLKDQEYSLRQDSDEEEEFNQKVVQAVAQFLKNERFQTTAQTFLAELESRGYPKPIIQIKAEQLQSELLRWYQSDSQLIKSQKTIQELNEETSSLRSNLQLARDRLEELQQQLHQSQLEVQLLTKQMNNKEFLQSLPSQFELFSVLGEGLQKIIPNILINKREEAIPLLIASICNQTDMTQRQQLISLLFNLIKKPSNSQCKVILNGMRQLAEQIGALNIENEVVPIVLEHASHPNPQRRALVAECCAYLIQFVPHLEQNFMSTWFELAVDGDSVVRSGVSRAISYIFEQGYQIQDMSCWMDLNILMAVDSGEDSSMIIGERVMPKFLAILKEDLLLDFVRRIMLKLQCLLQSNHSYCLTSSTEKDQSQMRQIQDSKQIQIRKLLQVFQKAIPSLYDAALKNKPVWATKQNSTRSVVSRAFSKEVEINQSQATEEKSVDNIPFLEEPINFSSPPIYVPTNPFTSQYFISTNHLQLQQDLNIMLPQTPMESTEEFAMWLDKEASQQWGVLDWCFENLLPKFFCCMRYVSPIDSLDGLRHGFVHTLRLLLSMLGSQLAQQAVLPLILTYSAIPFSAWPTVVNKNKICLQIQDQIQRIQPLSEGQKVDGEYCILPLCLAALTPQSLFTSTIKGLCNNVEDVSWAIQNEDKMLAAIRFAGGFKSLQQQLTFILWDLVSNRHGMSGVCGGLIARGLASCLDDVGILGHILPALQQMVDSDNSEIKQQCVIAISEVLQWHNNHDSIQQRCHGICEVLLEENDHLTYLAFLKALPAQASKAGNNHVEWLLQRMMFILVKIYARSSNGMSYPIMQSLVEALYYALYTIHSCQLSYCKVKLHLIAALESLKREGDLLCQTHREHLSEMLKEEQQNMCKMLKEEQNSDSEPASVSEANDAEQEYSTLETMSSVSSNFEEDQVVNKSVRRLLGRIRRNQSL